MFQYEGLPPPYGLVIQCKGFHVSVYLGKATLQLFRWTYRSHVFLSVGTGRCGRALWMSYMAGCRPWSRRSAVPHARMTKGSRSLCLTYLRGVGVGGGDGRE